MDQHGEGLRRAPHSPTWQIPTMCQGSYRLLKGSRIYHYKKYFAFFVCFELFLSAQKRSHLKEFSCHKFSPWSFETRKDQLLSPERSHQEGGIRIRNHLTDIVTKLSSLSSLLLGAHLSFLKILCFPISAFLSLYFPY